MVDSQTLTSRLKTRLECLPKLIFLETLGIRHHDLVLVMWQPELKRPGYTTRRLFQRPGMWRPLYCFMRSQVTQHLRGRWISEALRKVFDISDCAWSFCVSQNDYEALKCFGKKLKLDMYCLWAAVSLRTACPEGTTIYRKVLFDYQGAMFGWRSQQQGTDEGTRKINFKCTAAR